MRKLIYFIFFVLLSFELNAKTKPPFSNIIEHDKPKDYREIIRKSCERLNDNSFAVFVVGEVRENDRYVGFVPDTIRAFEDAGMSYYNEMILLQEPATAAMRAEKFMNASRKIPKSHQNVLMFSKGSPQDSAKRMGQFNEQFNEVLS